MRSAALMSPRWLKAWGKLPSSAPVVGSISSASRPRWLEASTCATKTSCASSMRPLQGERLGEPEAAQDERALRAADAVVVAGSGRGTGPAPSSRSHPVDGARAAADRRRGRKPCMRQSSSAASASLVAVGGDEVAPVGSSPRAQMSSRGLVRGAGSTASRSRSAPNAPAMPRAAVEREPAHQLRVDVVAHARARLPDAVVGLAPAVAGRVSMIGASLRQARSVSEPPKRSYRWAASTSAPARVELELIARAVADPHRPRAAVAGQVRRARAPPGHGRAVDRVHELRARARVSTASRRKWKKSRASSP